MLSETKAEYWAPAPERLALDRDEVHVWKSSLDRAPDRVRKLRELLNRDERERADRFHFQVHRDRFTVGRGLLRIIIGRYLGVDPVELLFSYNYYGKPSLDGAQAERGLRFNLSHSDAVAVYAVVRERELGVDVEKIRADFADEQIAERFFSRSEVAVLMRLPEEVRHLAFFNCWTRKEAYIKARGKGLSIGLDTFDVAFAPGQDAALLRATGDDPARWSLSGFAPEPGYVGAVAVEGHGWRLSRWQSPDLGS